MSNRFHNKLHRINHHSQRTAKNDTYTDASYDPIASYEAPFQGEFYSDGELVTHTYLSAASAIYTNDGTIFNDLFVGNNVTINNGLSVETDLLVKGNFTVLGSTSQIDTLVYVTSAMSITNVGTGPALLVNQTGNNIVADFRDEGVSSLFIDGRAATAGFIGINTNSPNERLTVVGNISAIGNLIVTENVSISGNQAVLGSVFVSGSQFIEDDLTVYRNTYLETLTAESPTFESYVATLGLSGAALDPNPFLFLGRMGINGLPKDTNVLHIQGGNLRIDGADYSTKDYSYLGGISALDTDGTALLDLRSSDVNQKYTLSIAESGVQNFLKISGGTLSNPQPKIVVKEGVPLLFGTHSSFFDDSFIEKVRIDSNGNVGIGESSPQQKLTVKGNVSAAGDGIFTGNFYVSGNQIIERDLEVRGGDLTTDQSTFNLINANASTVNFAGAANTLNVGAANSWTNLRGNLSANGDGIFTKSVYVSADVFVGGEDLISTTSNFNLINTNATTVNFAGAGTSVNIGASNSWTNLRGNLSADGDGIFTKNLYVSGNEIVQGDLEVRGGDLTTDQSTFNLINANASTVNFAGAGTSVNIGATNSWTNLRGNLSANGDGIFTKSVYVSADVFVGGQDLISTTSNFNLINTNASTVNFAGAGTSVNIGSSSGFVNVNNNLNVSKVLSGNGDVIFTKNLYLSGNQLTQGRIGIGRVAATERLEAQGAVLVAADTTTNQSSAATFDYQVSDGKARIVSWGKDSSTNGKFGIWTGTANNTPVERIVLDENGYVGIGTSGTLERRLTVQGDSRFNGNVTVTGDISAAGNSYFANTIFSTTSALSVVHIGDGPAAWIGSSGLGDIASFVDIDTGAEVLHVGGSNGTFPNVGIKTGSPNVDFTVNGQISASEELFVKGTITAETLNTGSTNNVVTKSSTNVLETRQINSRVWNTTANLLSGALTQNYLPKFQSGSSLVNSIVFDNGTFVGINTITPTATLDVSGSFKSLSANITQLLAVPVGTTTERVSAQGAIRYNTTDQTFEGYDGTEWGPIGGGALVDIDEDTYITVDSDPPTNTNQITFYANGSPRMIILSSGEVGIGELNPQQKLTVNGSISASNTVYISAVEFTGITTTATSITADNLFLQVNIGGVQKYLRLFDIE